MICPLAIQSERSSLYPDETYERGNPVQSYVRFLFLWNLKKGRITGASVTTGFQNYTIVLYIARSAKWSPKPLSKSLTCILSAVKIGR
jgi:hypothetical protein